jgi:hypothetical protein
LEGLETEEGDAKKQIMALQIELADWLKQLEKKDQSKQSSVSECLGRVKTIYKQQQKDIKSMQVKEGDEGGALAEAIAEIDKKIAILNVIEQQFSIYAKAIEDKQTPLKLQDALILACEHGDAKEVLNCIKRGAKPEVANTVGKYPLGAAVWGMNPEVVNELLKQMGEVAPMTWAECKEHNVHLYEEVFIVPKCSPETFYEWHTLLEKIDSNLFIRAYHLQKVNEKRQHEGDDALNWDQLKKRAKDGYDKDTKWGEDHTKHLRAEDTDTERDADIWDQTEEGYVSYRTQIKQRIDSTSRHAPTAHNPQRLMPVPSAKQLISHEGGDTARRYQIIKFIL